MSQVSKVCGVNIVLGSYRVAPPPQLTLVAKGLWPAGQAPFGAWMPMKLLHYATVAKQQQKKS